MRYKMVWKGYYNERHAFVLPVIGSYIKKVLLIYAHKTYISKLF